MYVVPIARKKCAYSTLRIYCAYGTSKILCLLHLKKYCCLQLCRLLPLLHLQQKFFFLQGHWRRRGRLRWQGRQHSHGACRQRWAREELRGWVRPHGLRPSRRRRRQLNSGLWRNKTTLRNKATPHSSQTGLRSRESRPRGGGTRLRSRL